MTEKLPRITAADTIRALEQAGFFFSRQSGSHKIYKKFPGNRIHFRRC
ncbi:MAG: type II toxin-antitoxin system HicA family toxin [Thermodesulfobacteriota bacterium]